MKPTPAPKTVKNRNKALESMAKEYARHHGSDDYFWNIWQAFYDGYEAGRDAGIEASAEVASYHEFTVKGGTYQVGKKIAEEIRKLKSTVGGET